MAERTGQGDAAKVVALLWRRDVLVGRSGLTVDDIVTAAVALADEQGLERLSMRRLAERLGRAAMAIYAHVPGRAELLDLIVDAALGEVELPPGEGGEWRRGVEAIVTANRALLARHPWLLDVDTARPPLGPGTIGKYDAELAALAGTGLGDVDLDQALTVLLELVWSGARRARAEEGEGSEADWWAAAGPALAEVMDPQAYPFASRVGEAAGQEYGAATDPERTRALGLRLFVAGLDRLVEEAPR